MFKQVDKQVRIHSFSRQQVQNQLGLIVAFVITWKHRYKNIRYHNMDNYAMGWWFLTRASRNELHQ